MTKEELQEIADMYGLYTEQDVENRVSCELLSMGARNEELEKAYNEAEELLDKQIEATYKVVEENKELKEQLTKAKEIIRALLCQLGDTFAVCYETKEESIDKAKQFLMGE